MIDLTDEQWERFLALTEEISDLEEFRTFAAGGEDELVLSFVELAIRDRIATSERILGSPGIAGLTILDVLGEGGMGTVYLARQHSPVARLIALKLLPSGVSDEAARRFRDEQHAVARMKHDSIARLFEAGVTPRGMPYFTMEYVEGVSITSHCDAASATVRERLELFITVCMAIEHAHRQRILHRDLKPSNILIAVQDGRPVPKLIDFGAGLSMDRLRSDRLTRDNQFLGTLDYMAPEQIASGGELDARTDVHALGVVLYELLTGSLPFESLGGSPLEIQQRIAAAEAEKPSARVAQRAPQRAGDAGEPGATALARQLRGDLDWITMRALEKVPGRRYQTARELAADLQRHLNDEPVQAGPPSVGYRLGKALRRRRGPFAAAGALTAVLLVAVLWWQEAAAASREIADRVLREQVLATGEAGSLASATSADELAAVARDHVSAMEAGGLGLSSGRVSAAVGFLAALGERAPETRDVVVEGLFDLAGLLHASGVVARDQPESGESLEETPRRRARLRRYADLVEVWSTLGPLLDRIEISAWKRDVWVACAGRKLQRLRTMLREIDERTPEEAGWFARLTMRLLQAHETGPTLRRLADERPDLFWPHMSLGKSYRERGEHEKAIKHLDMARALRPDSPWILRILGLAHRALGRPTEAARYLERATVILKREVGRQPKSVHLWTTLGNVHSSQGRHHEARDAFAKAVDLDPGAPLLHYNLATTHTLLFEVQQAIGSFREATRLEPGYAEAHCNLGRCLALAGRYSEAVAPLTKGHEIGSRREGWPYDSASWVVLHKKMAAEEELLRGLRKPEGLDELGFMAKAAYWCGKYTRACDYYEQLFADSRIAALDEIDGEPLFAVYEAATNAALQAAAGEGCVSEPPDGDLQVGRRPPGSAAPEFVIRPWGTRWSRDAAARLTRLAVDWFGEEIELRRRDASAPSPRVARRRHALSLNRVLSLPLESWEFPDAALRERAIGLQKLAERTAKEWQ